MNAVILAAGRSNRLRPLTETIPKCLLPVQGKSLLLRYLHLLQSAGVEKTIVVAGFNHPAVVKEIESTTFSSMKVEVVVNEDYASTHPIESFLLSEKYVEDSFFLLNSDIYFTETILTRLLNSPHSCIAIDSSAPFEPGEMFVNYKSDKRVTDISKSLTQKENDQGKSVQVAKILHKDKARLFDRARELAGKQDLFYPAQAYDVLIQSEEFFVVDVAGEFTQEIDTVADYELLLKRLLELAQ